MVWEQGTDLSTSNPSLLYLTSKVAALSIPGSDTTRTWGPAQSRNDDTGDGLQQLHFGWDKETGKLWPC